MSTQADYERYKQATKRKGKKPITFNQFRNARAHENMGQRTMAEESGIDVADVALMLMILSSDDDESETDIESFDKIEKELEDAGWFPDDKYEPTTSNDTTDWNNSGNDSASWDSDSSSSDSNSDSSSSWDD